MFVDSSASAALQVSGNAQVTAAAIDVVGGYQQSGNAGLQPRPTTGVAAITDPLASLPAPPAGTAQGSVNLSQGTRTLQPGQYSSITVAGNASLTLEPGIYVLTGGGLTVAGNASVTGSGVLIYNAGSQFPQSGGKFQSISVSGDGQVELTPATSGVYAGILIFQSRDNTTALSLSGNAELGSAGVIYAPAAALALSGNAQLNAALVVSQLMLSGNSDPSSAPFHKAVATERGSTFLIADNAARDQGPRAEGTVAPLTDIAAATPVPSESCPASPNAAYADRSARVVMVTALSGTAGADSGAGLSALPWARGALPDRPAPGNAMEPAFVPERDALFASCDTSRIAPAILEIAEDLSVDGCAGDASGCGLAAFAILGLQHAGSWAQPMHASSGVRSSRRSRIQVPEP